MKHMKFVIICLGVLLLFSSNLFALKKVAARYNVLEAIEAGVTNYIVKPIKSDQLWLKLKPYIAVGVGV